jgi:hypothetical protein
METEGSGLEMRVASSGLRLLLTLGDVRPSTPSFLESTRGLVRILADGQVALEKGSELMAYPEPT